METQRLNLPNLPTEILYLILESLGFDDLRSLSCVDKRLRGILIPILFRHVQFSFSTSSLSDLGKLAESQVRQHVRILSYTVPDLLKPGHLDFEYFKRAVFTPDEYIVATAGFYEDEPAARYPSRYMKVYDTLKGTCKDQQKILEKKLDLDTLTTSLRALPRINELKIRVCESLDTGHWEFLPLHFNLTNVDDSFTHHARTVAEALKDARNAGISLGTISLNFLKITSFGPSEGAKFRRLWSAVDSLLEQSTFLCVIGHTVPFELLIDMKLTVKKLELRHCLIFYDTWRKLLEVHRKSLHHIEIYDSKIGGMGEDWCLFHKISPQILSRVLAGFQFTAKESVHHESFFKRVKGWTIELIKSDPSKNAGDVANAL
ncbi:hypothetical protein BO78DRAFT_381069 [Aspergillus sclerotiicarbonarius CBS 121057]|uniref:F-box domain-containing protein n=1 Tax=Aspergillus sclerotiicarbonarius (strain CBS 121057 / IBT 28362) TaxID=1448318 RepID=A0A319DW68_ASPSB|nr:hypothetical protein BO78DRAFT_381069 [Aspergillus sclerotiicarbonarius CBS 121057]